MHAGGLVIRGCVIIIIESRSAIVSSYVSYWAGKQYIMVADYLVSLLGLTLMFRYNFKSYRLLF